MNRQRAIADLRKLLAADDISAIIIPTNDPHFGEYVPDYYKSRAWVSGFTGTAGTLVITLEKAALWVDSRYTIQGAKQLEGTDIELMKLKATGTPSIAQWLKEHLEDDAIVAMDENLFSYSEYQEMVDDLYPITPTLVEDPFLEIWKDRPILEFNQIRLMPDSVSGESISSKCERLIENINSPIPMAYIITYLDEIAWLTNLRGEDVEFNPLFLSYAVVTNEDISLFLRKEQLSEESLNYLLENDVKLFEYEEFTEELKKLPKNLLRIFSGNKIAAKNYFAALENIHQPPLFGPVAMDAPNGGVLSIMKSRKNEVELEGFRKAYLEDAKAWKKILSWIDDNKEIGFEEWDVAKKLVEFRQESPDYMGESFYPIIGYNANGALPHYHTPPEGSSKVKAEGLLLIDTGAQYKYGTTDITRTIVMGDITQEQKNDFTQVLKGMIAMSKARFHKGMRGCLLDILARGPIMSSGKIYLHGTCHGIGHNLCVHEGPQSIRMEENMAPLAVGNVMSNEPAVYVENKYGIRHENTLIVQPWISNAWGDFLEFETISYVPIDVRAVNYDLLTVDEKIWLEDYNKKAEEFVK